MLALFIILVSLRMTLFSEKMLISNRWIRGLMSNLIKKSWKVSSLQSPSITKFLIVYTWIVFLNAFYLMKWNRSLMIIIISIAVFSNTKSKLCSSQVRYVSYSFFYSKQSIFFTAVYCMNLFRNYFLLILYIIFLLWVIILICLVE